jgi:hypothetical protein
VQEQAPDIIFVGTGHFASRTRGTRARLGPTGIAIPLCSKPPNGTLECNELTQLIHAVPTLSLGAVLIARFRFWVKRAAARPYTVSFACLITSSSSLNLMTTPTGPKISSWTIFIDGSTLVKMVGLMKPSLPRRSPPISTLAPTAFPDTM